MSIVQSTEYNCRADYFLSTWLYGLNVFAMQGRNQFNLFNLVDFLFINMIARIKRLLCRKRNLCHLFNPLIFYSSARLHEWYNWLRPLFIKHSKFSVHHVVMKPDKSVMNFLLFHLFRHFFRKNHVFSASISPKTIFWHGICNIIRLEGKPSCWTHPG